ncbi:MULTISPECIES: carboxypeptidase-like regulatory domain-containing protein [unclassified Mucilaginibacter]|uniref:carboxypeptidase-like regulatory domain-containing protein n=1 Tax=unclassified Mucilaginibacter TaxID=2617802 RepID=UPI002AC8A434|nr:MULTISPECIES: carboxypeptidase-like regulatory domain-containing protein [unclassified Mucilaginibacter]MEB0263794.1 carboxypeptidase-like regulatory domain-containing protein [Mucilaginibacter sp. 10I4]MEB0278252.1 carboxypeptidase-like regulatory domain-containing protein [Mucilaginibacter sp. 10B2]MEB0300962.1 carboxypeptidase-like regulatory domain-containing protein [Mucilaginibacter sp. 5C4]WPX23898.1 carboxypeptidase-like regulatory domain-containing protein [Mucilaginibacter sp. 5C4]
MKKPLLSALFVLAGTMVFGQTITINGTVTDKQGKPVPYVFISDTRHPYGTYTNLEGKYNLVKADPASSLLASAAKFADTIVAINNKTDINMVLAAGAAKTDNWVKGIGNNSFFNTQSTPATIIIGSQYLKGGQQELHGSRFLYDKWVHGFGINAADSLIQSNDYLFNYDKLKGDLIFITNKQNAFIADKSEVKEFALFDDDAQPTLYAYIPSITTKQYVQVLYLGKKYKVYRQVITKFEANNFTTNGITNSGHNYDEYTDENSYFVLKTGAQPQKVSLKKKALKEAFAADAERFNKFASAQQGDIDENYLKDLAAAMDQ